MDEEPHDPAGEAAEADLVHAGDGAEPADRGDAAHVAVLEGDGVLALQSAARSCWRRAGRPAWRPRRRPGGCSPSPCRRPRTPRDGLATRGRGARRCGRRGRSRRRWLRPAWRRAATPGRRPPRSSCWRRSATCFRRHRATSTPKRVDTDDAGVHLQLDAETLQLLGRLPGEPVTERGERLLAAVEQEHAHRRRIERAELALQAAHRQLADLPGQLDAGRTGTDDDHRQPSLLLGGIGGDRGHLEGTEDAPAQLHRVVDGLHAGRVAGELVVAEVRLVDAGGDDQAVVRQLELAAGWRRRWRGRSAARGRSRSPRPARRGCSSTVARRGGSAGRSAPARACPSPPGTAAAGTGGGCGGRPRVTSTGRWAK